MRPGGSRALVVVMDNRSFHHSSEDPICDGYWHKPFDLFCKYEHNGDVKAAVKAAAIALDLQQTPSRTDTPADVCHAPTGIKRLPAASRRAMDVLPTNGNGNRHHEDEPDYMSDPPSNEPVQNLPDYERYPEAHDNANGNGNGNGNGESKEDKPKARPPRALEKAEITPFPLDCLPDWLRIYVENQAEQTETDPGMAAVVGLAALSSIFQGKYFVQVKAGVSPQYEPLTIWGLLRSI